MDVAQVVYCLSRGGHMEHPHMIQVRIPPEQQALRLRDVKKLLITMRGGGMAHSFSWSFKRMYKNNYIWQDLSSDDDVITPVLTGEYILKGSQMYDTCHAKHRVPADARREQGFAASARKGERATVSSSASTAPAAASPNLADYRIHNSALFNAKSPRTMILVQDISHLGSNKSLSCSLNRQVMDSLSSADAAKRTLPTDLHSSKVYQRLRLPAAANTVTVATQTDQLDNASCQDHLPPLKSRTLPRIPSHAQITAIDSPATPASQEEPSQGAPAHHTPAAVDASPPTPPALPSAAPAPAIATSLSLEKKVLSRICLRRGGKDKDEDAPAISSARLRGHSFRQLLCGVVDIRAQEDGQSPDHHQPSTPHSYSWLWRSRSNKTDSSKAPAPSERGTAQQLCSGQVAPEHAIPVSNVPSKTAATHPSASPDHGLAIRRVQSCASPTLSLSSAGVCTSPTYSSYSSSAVDSGHCESGSNSEASDARNTSATQSTSSGQVTSTPEDSFSTRHSFEGFGRAYLQIDKPSKEPQDLAAAKPLPPGFHKGMNDTKLRVRITPKEGLKDQASPRVPTLARAVAKHQPPSSSTGRFLSDKASPKSTLDWWNDSNSPRADFRVRGDRLTPGRSIADSLRGNNADSSRISIDWSRNSLDGKTLQDLAVSMLPPPEFRQHVEDCLQCGRTFKPESVKAHMRGCHVHRVKVHTANPNAVAVRRQ